MKEKNCKVFATFILSLKQFVAFSFYLNSQNIYIFTYQKLMLHMLFFKSNFVVKQQILISCQCMSYTCHVFKNLELIFSFILHSDCVKLAS